MTIRKIFVFLAVLALFVAACGDSDDSSDTAAAPKTTAAPETTTTRTAAPAPSIGTADNPIQVLFVPSVSAEDIIAGGALLDEALTATTGLEFEVRVGSSYAATIEEMCAAPDSTIGFIPAAGYVLANDLCGVEIVLKGERFGYDVYWTEFIVARDSDIESVEDLAGKKWAYPDATSSSGFVVPTGLFATLGVEVTDSFEAGSHSATARAVYNGEADFGTVFYSPPIDVDGNDAWDGTAANADVTDEVAATCTIVTADQAEGKFGEGDLVCGDIEIRDARRDIREEAPDVMSKVKIVGLTEAIPNDGLAFGPEFPADLKDEIVQAVLDYAATDPDGLAIAFDAYSYTDFAPTSDSEYDSIRALLQALDYTTDNWG